MWLVWIGLILAGSALIAFYAFQLLIMPAFWVVLAMILIVAYAGWGTLFFLFACFIGIVIFAQMN